MGKYVDFYCKDNNRELKKIVDAMLKRKFGWIARMDYDDFYSRAGEVVWECEMKFDGTKGISFEKYLIPCIYRKIKSQITYANRAKRMARDADGSPLYDISIDAAVGEDGSTTVGDLIPSDFHMEDVLEKRCTFQNERIEAYFKSLSDMQRRIVRMKMEGIHASEIKTALKLSDKQYKQNCQELKSFSKIQNLYLIRPLQGSASYWDPRRGYLMRPLQGSASCWDPRRGNLNILKVEEGDTKMSTATQTMENCKTDRISIASIIKKIEKHTIRFDHPLQRESDQWSPSMKGNLISDILQGNKLHPLIFAEQIINGAAIIWDLDGKQRCTNAYLFSKNGYKVSKNIRRFMIKYQITRKDEKGNEILDENGYPIVQVREFDIRGKKFSELPEELQDRFLDYSFNYDQYLNCTEEDIGYHIERYNDGKPMTASQKGITKLGTQYAEMVKSISNMSFFKSTGGYKVSEFKNGTIHRVVVESVMTANFLDHWKKNQEDMCRFMKENASPAHFEAFEDMAARLDRVVTEDVSGMFDSKDSFLWFGLFARFQKLGLEDEKFIAFLRAFSSSLHSRNVDGISYDDLCVDKVTGNVKSTKDKFIVIHKIKILESLMREYFSCNIS